MYQINLTDENQVKQVLLSIGSNILEWKSEKMDCIDAKKQVLRNLIGLALDIEKQTNIKTYESMSIATMFADCI